MNELKSQLKNLPKRPGVYLYSNKNGEIIYIGKASNLKNRVSSYFVGAHDTKTEQLVLKIAKIDYKVTDNVFEALLLESNLIKKYQPKYNIKSKDDKSYVNIYITKEEFPRIFVGRSSQLSLDKTRDRSTIKIAKVFGPFVSKENATGALKLLRKIFHFRDCGPNKFNLYKKRKRPCLYYSLGLCSATCAEKISKIDYIKDVRNLSKILGGKTKKAIRELEQQMKQYSKKQQYEKALNLRNQVFALKHINDASLIKDVPSDVSYQPSAILLITNNELSINRIEAYDISNIAGKYATGSMVVWENNEFNKKEYKKFKIRLTDEPNDLAMLFEVIYRRAQHKEWTKPDIILVDGGKNQIAATQKAIYKTYLKNTPIIGVVKNEKHKPAKILKNSNAQKIEIDEKILFKIDAESHRFAIKYHRLLRSKEFLKN